MKKLNLIFCLCLFSCFFLSCNTLTSQQNEQVEFEIINIQEFNTFFLMKSKKESNAEIVYLISLKTDYYEKIKSNYYFNNSTALSIESKYKYKFVLQQVKPRVSSKESLGARIIIDNDTLWEGKSYQEAPKTYITLNTLGLKINN